MIDAAHDDLCHAADPCVFRDLHRRSRPVHHGNLRPLLLRQVQIAAQLLYIPCGKEILQGLFGLAFPTDFSHPKKPLHIPMLGMPAPLGVVVRRFIHQDSWNLVNINPPGVECRGIRFSYSARPPVRSAGTMYPVLHAAPHSPPPDQRPLSAPDAPLTTGHTFCSRGRIAKKGFLASPEGASASGSYGKFAHSLSVCPLCTHPPTTRHRINTLSRYRITRNTTKP